MTELLILSNLIQLLGRLTELLVQKYQDNTGELCLSYLKTTRFT